MDIFNLHGYFFCGAGLSGGGCRGGLGRLGGTMPRFSGGAADLLLSLMYLTFAVFMPTNVNVANSPVKKQITAARLSHLVDAM